MYDFVHLVMFNLLNSNLLDLLACILQTPLMSVVCAKACCRQSVKAHLGEHLSKCKITACNSQKVLICLYL